MENLNKDGLKKLRKDLRGKLGDIARKAGKSVATVSAVLRGEFNNDEVMSIAIKTREEVMKVRIANQKKIESISNEHAA